MKSQLELNYTKAAEERDAGIEQAVQSANEACPDWLDKAYEMFKSWLKNWPSGFLFQMEGFRQIARIKGLPDPKHDRAYGAIAVRARKDGLIISNGFVPTKSVKSHRARANQWQKV